MDEFLSKLGSEASEGGEFTLDGRKAVERFRTFQEADPAYFFLRLVQVFNRKGVSRIDVLWTRDTVEISAPDCPFPRAEMMERPASRTELQDPDYFTFLVVFSCAEMAGRLGFSWSPDRLWLKSPLLPMAIGRAVEQRCRYSPAIISLNGETLDRDWPSALTESGEKTLSGFFAEWYQAGDGLLFDAPDLRRYRTSEGFYTWDMESQVIPRAREWYFHSYALGGEPHSRKFSAVYSVPHSWTGKSQLLLVKDGVCLDPLSIVDRNVGLLAVVGEPHVATDLSGLAPIEDETVANICKRARQRLVQLLVFVSKHRGYLPKAVGQASAFRLTRKDSPLARILRLGAAQSSRFVMEGIFLTVASWQRELEETVAELESLLEEP